MDLGHVNRSSHTCLIGRPHVASAQSGTLYRGREGMWSWVAHRVSGMLIFLFLLVHVLDTALVRVSPEAYNEVIGHYKACSCSASARSASSARSSSMR